MGLREALVWVLSGGAGVLISWIIERVEWPWFDSLRPDRKRYFVWVLTAVVALGAWGVMVAMGYSPVPATWRVAVEQGFAVLFVALVGSGTAHGVMVLRKK